MSTSSNKQPKTCEDGMGKAGKRKEMVKDRCAKKICRREVRERSVCNSVKKWGVCV